MHRLGMFSESHWAAGPPAQSPFPACPFPEAGERLLSPCSAAPAFPGGLPAVAALPQGAAECGPWGGPGWRPGNWEMPPTVPLDHRKRTKYTEAQVAALEAAFVQSHYVGFTGRERLSERTGVPEDRIQVWFQNRRARNRRKEIPVRPPGTPDSSSRASRQEASGAPTADRQEPLPPPPPARQLPQAPLPPASSPGEASADQQQQQQGNLPLGPASASGWGPSAEDDSRGQRWALPNASWVPTLPPFEEWAPRGAAK